MISAIHKAVLDGYMESTAITLPRLPSVRDEVLQDCEKRIAERMYDDAIEHLENEVHLGTDLKAINMLMCTYSMRAQAKEFIEEDPEEDRKREKELFLLGLRLDDHIRSRLLSNYAKGLVNQGKYDEAEPILDMAIEFDPQHPLPWVNLMEMLSKKGDLSAIDAARSEMEKKWPGAMDDTDMNKFMENDVTLPKL